MFVMLKKKKVYPAYVSKNNSNPEKTSYSFDDFKQKIIDIIRSNKFKK